MKKLKFILTVILIPLVLNANISSIDERVTDIYFANGILNTKKDAQASLDLIEETTLEDIYNGDEKTRDLETQYKLLYNNTYGKFMDALEVMDQKKGEHKLFWIVMDTIFDVAGKLGFKAIEGQMNGKALLSPDLFAIS